VRAEVAREGSGGGTDLTALLLDRIPRPRKEKGKEMLRGTVRGKGGEDGGGGREVRSDGECVGRWV